MADALTSTNDATNAPLMSGPDHEGPKPAHAAAADSASAPDAELEAAMTAVDFTQMSDAQLEALGSGDQEKIAQALNVDLAPTRISLRAVADPEERRAVADATRLVREGKHSSLRSALAEVMGLAVATPAPDATAAEQEALQTLPEMEAQAPAGTQVADPFGELQTDHQRALDFFDYDQALELHERMSTLRTERQQAEAQERGWTEAETTSWSAAVAAHPALADAQSEFARLVDDEMILAEHRQDAVLFHPDWPEKIAARVAEKHGGTFGGGTAEPGSGAVQARMAVPPPPPRPGVRLPGSPVGPGANTVTLTAKTALAEFDRLTLEQQDAVLTALDVSFQRRAR
jgi:hypothetical protein